MPVDDACIGSSRFTTRDPHGHRAEMYGHRRDNRPALIAQCEIRRRSHVLPSAGPEIASSFRRSRVMARVTIASRTCHVEPVWHRLDEIPVTTHRRRAESVLFVQKAVDDHADLLELRRRGIAEPVNEFREWLMPLPRDER